MHNLQKMREIMGWAKLALVASALCVATATSSAFAETRTVTNTVNGIAWQLLIDTSNNSVSVGPAWGNPSSEEWKANGAPSEARQN